jgi:hypothetical protein
MYIPREANLEWFHGSKWPNEETMDCDGFGGGIHALIPRPSLWPDGRLQHLKRWHLDAGTGHIDPITLCLDGNRE